MATKLIRTNEEAIDCLIKNKPTSGYQMLQESVDMAIEALKNKEGEKNAVINYSVAVLADVAESARQEDAPIYEGDKEVDQWVRLSDVEDAINKYLKLKY